MEKLLYIAFNNCENVLYGVQAKIQSQCKAFRQHGYEVELIERSRASTVLMHPDGHKTAIKERRTIISNYYARSVLDKQYQIRDIKAYLKGKIYDACYIRYDFSDPGFISLLKNLKQVCKKIAVEFPTYPYDEENSATFLSRMKLSVDIHFRRQLKKYVDFIVTFYDGYKEIFGIPTVVIPNGFDFSTFSLVQSELQDEEIHIIAVSSMREWHGYERIIEGLHNYYENNHSDKRNIVLHLVGNGREYVKYRSLVDKYELQSHVIMEGAMHGEQLDNLYEVSALGIDSLARHRSGIDVLSSLKSREYGAKGIPMINSCRIDIIDDDFPYLLRVPADESPIDVQKIVAFYEQCYCNGKSRYEICSEVRDYFESRSSMQVTMKRVVEQFSSQE